MPDFLNIFPFYSYYFLLFIFIIFLFAAIEIVAVLFLKIKEKDLRFFIAGVFTLTALFELYIIVRPSLNNLNILSIFGQRAFPTIIIFCLNLFASLFLINYERLSIKKTISLKNAYIFLGVLQLAAIFLLSQTAAGSYLKGWFNLFETFFSITIFYLLFPLLSIATGLVFHLVLVLNRFLHETKLHKA